MKAQISVVVRFVSDELPTGTVGDGSSSSWGLWVAFFASWLTFASSAGNWVFYAAMNRDLRTIMRFEIFTNLNIKKLKK